MARDFGGDAQKIRRRSTEDVTRALELDIRDWKASELRALSALSLVLALIPDLRGWSKSDKGLAGKIIRAKASIDKANYLYLLQRHSRLRAEIIRLGS